ncbi:unnamed protein product [Pedinophyceae sp. YPF-701]|nr:unnamed protein product [Pedinophyceae sp. YPF-701]
MTTLDNAIHLVDTLVASIQQQMATGPSTSAAAPAQGAPAAAKPKAEKKQKKEKKEKAPPAPSAGFTPPAEHELFYKGRICVARITSVEEHPTGSDKLWVMKVDVGGEERQLCAGLRAFFPDRADLQGRLVATVVNLKAAKLGGVNSEAMILAASVASDGAKETVVPLAPPADCQPGDVVYLEGEQATEEFPKTCKHWSKIVEGLAVGGKVARWNGTAMVTAKGPLSADIADGAEIH